MHITALLHVKVNSSNEDLPRTTRRFGPRCRPVYRGHRWPLALHQSRPGRSQPDGAEAPHMTEVECEISTQTFMSSRPALHHLGASSRVPGTSARQMARKKKQQIGLQREVGEPKGEEEEEEGRGKFLPDASVLSSRRDFTHRYDLTRADGSPTPPSVSRRHTHKHAQAHTRCHRILPRPLKLLPGFDKSCSVYYDTRCRGAKTQICTAS